MSVVAKSLTKQFGTVRAVDAVNFEIKPGEVTGLLGPNGAGKTTTVRLISGFLLPSSGTCEVDGIDVRKDPNGVRRLIGYLPEENPLYPDMDVIDYLEFIARMQSVPRREMDKRIREMVGIFGLGTVKHIDIGRLSKGYRQRVGLAQTMIHDPKILIFDEPTNGLDPNQVMEFRRFVSELGKEKTVIFSTHVLAEVQALCNRVIIMGKGKVLSDATFQKLQEDYQGGQEFFVAVDVPASHTEEFVKKHFEELGSIKSATPVQVGQNHAATRSFHIEASRDADLVKDVFELSVRLGWKLVDLQRRRVKIEDIFRQLTRGGNPA